MLMSVSRAGPSSWVIVAGALALGCAPHQDTTVVHVADPAPAPADPPEEPALDPAAEPSALVPRPPPDMGDPFEAQDSAHARARELFEQGAEAYAQGDYPTARQAFEAAYDLVPERALLFNIASCEMRMQDLVSACAHFRQYVAEGDPSDPRVQQVQAQVASRCGGVP